MSGEFHLVFVCTGNRFRSPLAEAHVRALTTALPVQVESMGTSDIGALPALPEALALGSSVGLDLSAHRARTLVPELLAEADLVLGFEEMHIWDAVMDGSARRDRIFTLPEFVALLARQGGASDPADDVVAQARLAVELAHEARKQFRTAQRPQINDPLGRGPAAFADVALKIAEFSAELTARLFRLSPGDELPLGASIRST